MTLQFPASPSLNQMFTASNRIIYKWDGEKWITLGSSQAAGDFVSRTGDNMTGDLTLGTDKITLDAGNGSASFAGNIVSGGPSVFGGTDKGSLIGYEGNSGFTAASSSSAIRVWTQGNSTPTVDILGSGSASFSSRVTVDTSSDPSNSYAYVGVTSHPSRAVFQATNTAGGLVFAGYDVTGQTSSIAADGSASFAKSVLVENSGTNTGEVLISGAANEALKISNGSAYTTQIKWDGTASFSGVVYSGGNAFNGGADGSRLSPGGAIYASTASGTLWGGYTTGSSTFTSRIDADGSASFSGSVTSGEFNAGSVTANDINVGGLWGTSTLATNIAPNGVGIRRDTAGGVFSVYNGGYAASNEKVSISSAGNASFAGAIVAGADPTNGASTGFQGNSSGVMRATRSTGNLFEGYSLGTSTATSQIKADGTASFAGNITAGPYNAGSTSAHGATLNAAGTIGTCQVQSASGTSDSSAAIVVRRGTGVAWTVNYGGVAAFSNAILKLDPDNSANYTSTTNADGGTESVYNGPTLDVKESIRTMQAALYRLKAAVLIPDTSVDQLRLRILEALETISEEEA